MEIKVVKCKKSSSANVEYFLSILVVATALTVIATINYESAKLIAGLFGIENFSIIFIILNAAAAAVICANSMVIYKIIPSIMVRPSSDEESSRIITSYSDISEITINTNELLKGYLISGEDHESVLIYFGGIDEVASRSAIRLHGQKESGELDISCDVAVVDWPEYGQSSGKATADSLKQAAADVVRHFRKSHKKVIIMGYSMGTGYAVYAANECGCDDLILISPYSDASDLCNSAINVFHGITSNLLTYKLPVSGYAGNVEVTPMIFASRSDRRVKYKASLKLGQSFKNGSLFIGFDNLSHGEMPLYSEVTRMISERIG